VRERRAIAVHQGGLRFAVTTGTDRTLLYGEQAEGNEHSPVELILTALASCTGMDVISILEKKRQPVETYTVHADAVQRDEYPQVLTRIELVHEVAGASVTEEGVRRAVELSATKYCPVSAMLSAGATEIHHRYRVLAADGATAEGEVVVTGPFRRPDPLP
jgi:putative redox protein